MQREIEGRYYLSFHDQIILGQNDFRFLENYFNLLSSELLDENLATGVTRRALSSYLIFTTIRVVVVVL